MAKIKLRSQLIKKCQSCEVKKWESNINKEQNNNQIETNENFLKAENSFLKEFHDRNVRYKIQKPSKFVLW